MEGGRTTRKRASQDEPSPRKKRKGTRDDDGDIDTEAGLNKIFERMDSQLLADHLAKKTSRFGTDLSPVELSDFYISGKLIIWVVLNVDLRVADGSLKQALFWIRLDGQVRDP